MRRDELCAWLCITSALVLFVAALTAQWPLALVSAVLMLAFGALALRDAG